MNVGAFTCWLGGRPLGQVLDFLGTAGSRTSRSEQAAIPGTNTPNRQTCCRMRTNSRVFGGICRRAM